MTSISGDALTLVVVVLSVGLALLRWPELGTLLATAILYLNLLPIAIRYHHVTPLAVAAVAALLVPALFKYWVLDRDGFIIDRPLFIMLAFLACSIVSALAADSIEVSLPWIIRYATQGLGVYLLLINLIRTKDALRRLTWVLVVCGALLSGLSLYQQLTGSYTSDFGGLATRRTAVGTRLAESPGTGPRSQAEQRAHGPDLDANRYAQILIVLLPMAWCLIRNEATLWGRAAVGVSGTLILAGVILTYSRGAFLALVAAVGLMGAVRAVTVRQMLFVGAIVVIGLVALNPGYVKRMGTLRGIEGMIDPASESEVAVEPVTRTRGTIMVAAWRVFRDHPILGVGPGQFEASYVIRYGAELYVMNVIDRHYAAHSLYLQLAAETGVVGLGVFMWIVIAMLARLAAERRRSGADDAVIADWVVGVGVAISAYLVSAVFLHLAYPRYLWLLLGVGGATLQLAERSASMAWRNRAVGAC